MPRHSILPRYFVLAAADLVSKGLGFLVAVVIVRQLGAEAFGTLSFVAAFLAFALIVGAGGTDLYAIRRTVAGGDSVPSLAGTLLVLRTASGLVVYAGLVLLAVAVPALRPNWGLFALYGLTVFTAAASLAWVPQALRRTGVLAVATFAGPGVLLGILVTAFLVTREPWVVPVAQVVADGLVAAGLLVWAGRIGCLGRPLPVRRWWGLLREAVPIGSSRLFRALALSSDLVILGLLVPPVLVGLYAAAHKLFILGISLGAGYFVVLFPRLAELEGETADGLGKQVAASRRQLLALTAVPVIVLLLCPGWVLTQLFGEPFAAAAWELRLLTVAAVANVLGNLYRHALVARNRQRSECVMAAGSAGVHVAAKLALVPFFGIIGAAVGTLLGELVMLILGWAASRQGDATPPNDEAKDGSLTGTMLVRAR